MKWEQPKTFVEQKVEVHITEILKKFCLGYKNLVDQAKLGRQKTIDFKDMHKVIEANFESIK